MAKRKLKRAKDPFVVKRKRGRPPKNLSVPIDTINEIQIINDDEEIVEVPKEIDFSEEAVEDRLSRLEDSDEEM